MNSESLNNLLADSGEGKYVWLKRTAETILITDSNKPGVSDAGLDRLQKLNRASPAPTALLLSAKVGVAKLTSSDQPLQIKVLLS